MISWGEHVLGGCYGPSLCMPVCIILYSYYKGEIFLSFYSILYLCDLVGHVYVLGGCHELCLCMSVRIILYHYEGVQLMLSLYSILYLCELGGRVLGRFWVGFGQ